MKNFVAHVFLLLFSQMLSAQNMSGVWKGHISTPEKDLPYELFVEQNAGLYKAYSLITFEVNKQKIIVLRNVRVTQNGNELELVDEAILEDNLTENLPRKIKQISHVTLSNNYLVGKYKTQVPKNIRSSSGSMELVKVPDSATISSAIALRLIALKVTDATALMQTSSPADTLKDVIAATAPLPEKTIAQNANSNPQPSTAEPEFIPLPIHRSLAMLKPLNISPPVFKLRPTPQLKRAAGAFAIIPIIQRQPTTAATDVASTPSKAPPAQPVKQAPATVAAAKPIVQKDLPVVDLGNRKIETIETLQVLTDSLVLTLYDNGEVDGDTVSVILNGRILIHKQELSTRPVSQTIYLTPDLGNEISLVMYAENLGSIAPNTGLLIIQDGPVRREIRFSGDLQKNAGIKLLRRRE